jgi:hypothetical protein
METNNKFPKSGKALLFITSGLLLSDPCFGAPRKPWTPEENEILTAAVQSPPKQQHKKTENVK